MRTSIVTGAGGFVGTAVARKLLERGDKVVALGLSRKPDALSDAIWVQGSITDAALVRDIVARYEPEEVYHYAASSLVRGAVRDPAGAVQTNAFGTAALLEACRLAGVPSILIASSDKAYGEPTEPVSEESPLRPKHVYDVSKACTDLIATAFAVDFGTPLVVTRSCNIFGPGDLNWSRVVPKTCLAIHERKRPVIYDGAGGMEREFVFVSDYVSAALLLTEKLASKEIPIGQAYNIGTGLVYRVRDFIQEILVAANSTLEPEIRPREGSFGELWSQSVDSTKLRKLGWSPLVTVKEGLKISAAWYGEYLR